MAKAIPITNTNTTIHAKLKTKISITAKDTS